MYYTVVPKRIEDLDELKDELLRIKPDSYFKNPTTQKTELVTVVVEPGAGAVYADVAPCVDTILSCGFQNINFGGGLGSRRTGAYAKQAKPGKGKKR